jgi:AraC family transcriptional regulator of adaptative response / DNA-3-methyladenine glycosylase II
VTLRLAHTSPYPWPAMRSFLAARATPGVEEVVGDEYRRAFAHDGAFGRVAVRPGPGGGHLVATIRVSRVAALPALVGRLRRLLDLDADAQAIDGHLARDRTLAPLVRALPGLRVPGAWDELELAVRAILGQQVSVQAARTLAGRIAAAYGEAVPGEQPGVAFPGPERLADASLDRVGLPRARAAAVTALARAVLESPSLLRPERDLEAAVERLAALPGIGEWTAQYIAMRALRIPDAFPASDLGLLRAMARGGVRPTPRDLLRRAERWRPWRAYAAVHLWTAAAAAAAAGRPGRRPG